MANYANIWGVGKVEDRTSAIALYAKTVRCEEVYLNDYETFQDVVARLPRFLEEVYNQERLHSAPGYLSPMDLEERHAQQVA